MTARDRPPRPRRRLAAEALLAGLGCALVLGALLADQAWFDHHFLPVYFLSRRLYVLGETLARIAVALAGLALILLRSVVGRMAERTTPAGLAAGAGRAVLALLLAAGISEAALRAAFPRATEEAPPRAEPLRRHDPLLGWTFVPSRVAHVTVAGRAVDYAFDAQGYRVPSLAQPVDPSRPTVLFTGESIVTGFGLPWAQTIPARVGAALGLQAANMAVFAYADDQSYLRLAQSLPRFARPRAVVILFSPGLLFRDFDDDRPHLGPDLAWRPAVAHWRLAALLRFFVPYHGAAEIDRQVARTRAELQAGVGLARARGAAALIVVPHYGPEDPRERLLRRRILDQPGLPYVWVQLDPAWRIPRDPHPDARGAQVISAAIAARLSAGERFTVAPPAAAPPIAKAGD
jgi:hypothetical protein